MDERMVKAMDALEHAREQGGIKIDGRMYARVVDRVNIFRRHFGTEFGIDVSVSYDDGLPRNSVVIARAMITNSDRSASGDRIIAVGHATEFVGSNDFTTYSPIEVAETSAIGRALAAFGLSGGEYASSNEIDAADHRKEVRGPSNGHDVSDAPHVDYNSDEQEEPFEAVYYVPAPNDPLWNNIDKMQEKILNDIDQIKDIDTLGIYWEDLKPPMGALAEDFPKTYSEIKASFQAAYSVIEGGKQ